MSAMNTEVTIHHSTWTSDQHKYRCGCCCGTCCHIQVWCAIMAGLSLVGGSFFAIYGMVAVAHYEGVPRVLVSVLMIGCPGLMALTSGLVLCAIFRASPCLVLPHIILLMVQLVLNVIVWILLVLAFAGVSTIAAELLHTQANMSPLSDDNPIGFALRNPVAEEEERLVKKVEWLAIVGVSVGFLVVLGVEAAIINWFFHLKNFLHDKQAVRMGKAVELMNALE